MSGFSFEYNCRIATTIDSCILSSMHSFSVRYCNLRNSDTYVLPQCTSSTYKRSFVNWCLFDFQ